MGEPTRDDVRAAIAKLSDELLQALATGEHDDPDECHACDVFDPWLWGPGPDDCALYDPETESHVVFKADPYAAPIAVLADWHDFYADNGRGQKAYERCQELYALARAELQARAEYRRLPAATPMGSQVGAHLLARARAERRQLGVDGDPWNPFTS